MTWTRVTQKSQQLSVEGWVRLSNVGRRVLRGGGATYFLLLMFPSMWTPNQYNPGVSVSQDLGWGKQHCHLWASLKLLQAQGKLARAKKLCPEAIKPSPGTTPAASTMPQEKALGNFSFFHQQPKPSWSAMPEALQFFMLSHHDLNGSFLGEERPFTETAHLPAESLGEQEARRRHTPRSCPSGADWVPGRNPCKMPQTTLARSLTEAWEQGLCCRKENYPGSYQ